MKKSHIVLIVFGVCVLIGLVIGGIGVMNGGLDRAMYVDEEGVHVVREEDNMTEKKELQEFKRMELNVPGVSVTLQEGEGFALEYDFLPQIQIKRMEVADGTLYVECEQEFFSFFNFGLWRENTLTVYYPEGTEFESVETTAGSGSLRVSNLNAKTAKLVCSSGALSIEHLKGEEICLTASSGSVKANGVDSTIFAVSASSGSIKLENITVKNTLTMGASSGSVTMNEIKAGSMSASASSGSVRATNITAEEQVTLAASSGSVTAREVMAGTLTVTTSSGSVSMENCTADTLMGKSNSGGVKGSGINSKDTIAQTTSGSIHLEGTLTGSTVAKSTSGSVRVQTKAPKGESAYLLHSNSGSTRVDGNKESGTLNKTAENTFDLSATSGSVSLDFVQ